MILPLRLAAKDVRARVRAGRQASGNTSRLLLLVGALLIMLFPWSTQGVNAPMLGALLGAAAAAAVALCTTITIHQVKLLRLAEWASVGVLLLAGLITTAEHLAPAFAGLSSAVRLATISAYTILGLFAALLLLRRLPHLRWVFPLFLLAHAALTVAFLRSSPIGIDVLTFLHDGSGALLRGDNPYSMTFPNIYPPRSAEVFYGPGVVVNGRVTYGFPYLPITLVVAIPGRLLGDVRYSQLVAMLVTALVLRRLASDRVGRAAAVLAVASPSAIFMLNLGWTEPTLVALLACLVLALERRREVLAAAFLGLFMVSKQYVMVALPLIWLIREWLTRRVILVGVGLAAAVTLPFFLVNPAAFWKAIVQFQLVQPFRADSVSLLVYSVNTFGWPPPWTYSVLSLLGGGLTALAVSLRAPRTPAAFAAGVGLTLLVTILLSKQAFLNYYFLVSGAFLIAAVAWPTHPGPTKAPPDRSRSGQLSVGRVHGDDDDEPADNHDRSEHGPGVDLLVEHNDTGGEDRQVSQGVERVGDVERHPREGEHPGQG